MRVTLVTYDDTPPEGGQGVLVRDMRPALESHGVDITTVSGRGDHAISYRRVTRRAPLDFSLHVSRHPEVLAATNPDVLHLMGGPGGVMLTRRRPWPVVVTANHTYSGVYGKTSPRRALSVFEAQCYRLASHIVAISADTATAVRAMGIPRSRVEVLPPGVNAPAKIDEALRVPGRILFVGRLESEKGVADALALMRALTTADESVSGVVIGRGHLAEMVTRSCDAGPRMTYLGGADDARLAQEYAAASVVVVPSRYEGLGLVALEAMAAGAVVCGYDVVGLRDAALGVAPLVAAGDIHALIKEVRALLDDDARRADLAARGRAAVLATHSWEAYARRLVEIYATI